LNIRDQRRPANGDRWPYRLRTLLAELSGIVLNTCHIGDTDAAFDVVTTPNAMLTTDPPPGLKTQACVQVRHDVVLMMREYESLLTGRGVQSEATA